MLLQKQKLPMLHQVQEWQELSDEPEDLDIQALAEYLDVLMEQAE